MVIVPEEDREIIYESYLYLFNLNKKSPHFFTDMRLNAIFSAFIISRKWGWNVVAISTNAYLKFQEIEFKKKPKKIVRGHIKSRMETTRLLFHRNKESKKISPYTTEEFWNILLPSDVTILMTVEENAKGIIPPHYKFNNDEYKLFTNDGINYIYKQNEINFLKNLNISEFGEGGELSL